MAQKAMTIRLDQDLKVQFDALCKGRVAFDEIRSKVESGEIPSLTSEEINEEIRLSREGK
ncbi:MAG: hypothetical protein IKP46_01460 [Bacteroidales bacterium]|nr:hypothetical protein [Bacteroidales bacterium]